jgi:hypothetical protein
VGNSAATKSVYGAHSAREDMKKHVDINRTNMGKIDIDKTKNKLN